MGDMHRLPDGSGFFTATIGERPPGFIMWLKARPNGSCRRWLLLWRNYRSAYTLTREPDQGPPMSHWRALHWALAACSDADEAVRVLKAQGYTDIATHGWSLWGCGTDDNVKTEFTAKGPGGTPVEGVVCSGLLFKGATVRIF